MMKKWSEIQYRQKDRMIAEKLMNYTVRRHGYYDGGFQLTSEKSPAYYLFDAMGNADWHREHISVAGAWADCPHYSTNMGLAWEALRFFVECYCCANERVWDRFCAVHLRPHLSSTNSENIYQWIVSWEPDDLCFAMLYAMEEVTER